MTAKQRVGGSAPDGSHYVTVTDGAGNLTTVGSGDTTGAASSTDNAVVRFDGTGGKTLQNSGVTIDDSNNVSGAVSLQRTAGVAIQGTNTNDSAAAGYVGELIESDLLSGSAVSLTTNTQANVTSVSLTAGDWDVWGNVVFAPSGGAQTRSMAYISSASATLPTKPNKGAQTDFTGISTSTGYVQSAGQMRVSLSATTTVYLQAFATFAGTCTAYGYIGARRVR